MVADMNFYRHIRRTDPTFREAEAIKDWLVTNPEASVRLAEDIWPEMDPNGYPMDWDAVCEHLDGLEPLEAFYAGYYSQERCNISDDYYTMDGYGHFSSMDYDGFEEVCVDFMCNHGYRAILNGDHPAPEELAEVLALWGTAVRTDNRRPTPKCKGGSCGRPVAKKVPTKKTGSANTKSKSTKSGNTKSKSVRSKTPAKRCRA